MRVGNRSLWLGGMVWTGCALGVGRISPTDLAMSDGATLDRDAPVRIAIVGASPSEPVVRDVTDWDPDVLLLVGDQVERSTTRNWTALQARWGPLLTRAALVPGLGEHRGDRRLRGLRAAFPDAGIPSLNAGWWHIDLTQGGVRWRLVLLDAEASAWSDQVFWLPKVLSGEAYQRLMVVVGARGDEQVRQLADTVRDHAPPTALTAWITGGEAQAAIALPEGPFGHAEILVGPAGASWWRATLHGADLELTHRTVTPTAWSSTPIRSSEAMGWAPSR